MLKFIKATFVNRILGKDFYIVTLETPEAIEYEIYRANGSTVFGTKMK